MNFILEQEGNRAIRMHGPFRSQEEAHQFCRKSMLWQMVAHKATRHRNRPYRTRRERLMRPHQYHLNEHFDLYLACALAFFGAFLIVATLI